MMLNNVKTRLSKKCLNFFKSDCIRIKIVGIVNTIAFQRARICAEKLYQHLPFKFSLPQIIEMFQMDWYDYIHKMKRQIGGKIWSLTETVAVFINDEFLGNDTDLLRYVSQDYIFSLPIGAEYYENLAIKHCKQFMEKSKRKYVYFTFSIDEFIVGSLVFMLYSDLLPITCQHFLNLCTGYNEMNECYQLAYYINTYVHRIVKNGWIQCGGYELPEVDKDDTGNITIPDESYCVLHDRRGVLSMANDGKHCNKSQFVVCLKPNPWMNCYYVAFGQLIDGARTLKTLEDISTYYESPTKQIKISQCGEYIFGDEVKMETESKIFLKYEKPCMGGEDTGISDTTFDFYSITPWLDNIVDEVDLRDTASLLMVERYLHGFYCLATDYEPGMDMRLYAKVHLADMARYDSTTTKLRDLLLNFQPDTMIEREKLAFISEISKIILAYIFYHEYNEFCLQHISLNTHEIIHKILKIAHEIALKAIKKAGGKFLISRECGKAKIAKIFEEKHTNKMLVPEGCMLLLEEILNKAILCLMKTFEAQE
ncbi:unnamed protein product [Xylocopa violacea]|uniref:PPIase cyclophilin-type domain-containing protein n=1 Tax=Xylocopa violacea TaxID=135666 RepID=A0ABP1NUJ1_XYLVO